MRPAGSITAESDSDAPLVGDRAFGLKAWQRGALLVLLASAAFAPVFGAGWMWGDAQNVTENVLLRTWRGLGQVWAGIATAEPYRPLSATTSAMQLWTFGTAPSGYHFVSLTLHALNVLLLWKLLRRLEVRGAWLGAALFAVHPSQATAVAWVSQQQTLLAVTLVLISILSLVRWLEVLPDDFAFEDKVQILSSHPAVIYAGACFGFLGAALLDASVALTFPVVMLALVWWKQPEPMTRRQRLSLIPFAALTLVALGLSAWNVRSAVFLQLGAAGGHAAAMLLDLLVPVPALLNRLHTVSASWGGVARSALAFGIAAALLIWLGRRRPNVPRGVLAALWVLFSALMAGALFRRPMLRASDVTIVDGAAAYVAAAPLLALAAAWVARRVAQASARFETAVGRLLPVAAAAVLPLGLGVVTAVGATARFANTTAFWHAALEKQSTRPLALRQLGAAELAAGRASEAERYYAAARDLNRADVEAVAGLAESIAARSELHDAAVVYRQGLRAVPGDQRLTVGLAALESRRGNRQDAIELFESALGSDPKNASLHNDLAAVLITDGQRDLAIDHLRQALALDPTHAAARINLATAFFQSGQYASAAKELSEVLRRDPTNFDALLSAGSMLAAMKEYTLAEKALRTAVRIRKESYDAWITLASVLEERGKKSDADWCRSVAAKLNK